MSANKKILIVAHRWLPRYGGLQNVAFMYAEELANKYEVTVFTSKEKGFANIKPKNVQLVEGNSFHWLYNYFGIAQPIFTYSAVNKLENAVKESDLVIINDRYYVSSIFANKYAKKYGKKTILILHTPILNYRWPLSVFYNFNNKISRKVVLQADKIYGPTKETIINVFSYFNMQKEADVLYNPSLNMEHFKSKVVKFEKFTILFVGRFVEKKGVDLLPKIAERLLIYKDVEIIAIGDGPEYDKIINDSKSLSNIKFTGKITRERLVEYYKKSHIFVLTSRHGETFPLVLIDAFASGLPCVSTNGGTYTEIFNHDIGYLCKSGDITCLVKGITSLKENKQDYLIKSENAVKFAREDLDIKKLSKKLERGVEECLNGRT
ncbi:glycosyltransferase family 4 protein [Candidatus Pacearchaeota archaeon]|nr:glycosyltransferase family 4 protein [Candidatus Pacearchaeota archaeon]